MALCRQCPLQCCQGVTEFILDQRNLPRSQSALLTLPKGMPGRIFFSHAFPRCLGLFIFSQSEIKAHEQTGDLGKQTIVVIFFRILFIISKRPADKIPAVFRIRDQLVPRQVRRHRVHGNSFSDRSKMQVTEPEQHSAQNIRAKCSLAQFHEKPPVQSS